MYKGEKILLLDILEKAAKELSDNPEKYNPEKYNEFNENQNFYFKPVGVKYCKKKYCPETLKSFR